MSTTIPDDLASALRDIADKLRREGHVEVADDLERLVNRHSGGRPVPSDGHRCTSLSPRAFSGYWRDWHRGSRCSLDDGIPRTHQGAADIAALGDEHPKRTP